MLIISGVLALFVIILVMSGIKIVQQSQTVIVERLGKYNKTLTSGINIIIPIVDKPRMIYWRFSRVDYEGRMMAVNRLVNRIDLREAVFDFPKQNVITRDNVVTEINAILYYQVTDPVKATYEIANLPEAIEKLTQTTLRNVIGEMDLDQTLTSRDTINSKLRHVLDDASNKWGVKVNRVELQDINPPRDIRDAMEKQMRAERDKRATILEAEGRKASQILEAEGKREAEVNKAEGDKQANILRAEGDAQAQIRRAEGEAQAIRNIMEAVAGTGSNPANYLLAVRYIETLKEMVDGDQTKTVYMPYEATGVLGSLGGIKDLFQLNK
ncbi:MAG: SPFH/Band 7/PHB domain protein [Rikenellaceae bacterium]|jgi:regulator of protease activity HflC (stomatin/prohibitin superfamily)|nr:SPFH/Band 7/PHB domain protein [Rikenellaceae bacterium]